MPRRGTDRLWLAALVLTLGGVPAAAGDALRCTPDLPVFCGNIHVSCAGRTRIRTSPFTAELAPGSVRFDDNTAWEVETREDGHKVLLQRRAALDWITIDRQRGTFAQRIYRGPKGLMTKGRCIPAD